MKLFRSIILPTSSTFLNLIVVKKLSNSIGHEKKINSIIFAAVGLCTTIGVGLYVYNTKPNTENHQTVHMKILTSYENKLRAFSPPDKVFKYFASLEDKQTGEKLMTPEDFVRSFSMNWTDNRKESSLVIFKKIDAMNYHEDNKHIESFNKISENGLISYPLFLFLHSILSTPKRNLMIAFKIIDTNNDGLVSVNEFKNYLMAFFRSSHFGSTKYDSKYFEKKLQKSGILNSYFFVDEKGFIVLDYFLKLCENLKRDVINLEFNRFNQINDKITEKNFSSLITCYSEKLAGKFEKRLIGKYKNLSDAEKGISFEDYESFTGLHSTISDIDIALSFIQGSGFQIDKYTLKQVAQKVSNVQLSDHLIDVLFDIFDENGDGKLDRQEFITVLKGGQRRGLRRNTPGNFFLSLMHNH